MVAGDIGNINLSQDEVYALLSALNFTRQRTLGISWLEVDENLLRRLKEMSERYRGLH